MTKYLPTLRLNSEFSIALGALTLAVLGTLGLRSVSFLGTPELLQQGIALGVVWIPLGASIVWVRLRSKQNWSTLFGLRFHWIDLLWGVGIGLLARVSTTLFESWLLGTPGGAGGIPSEGLLPIVPRLIVPVLFAPVFEELFFRGLLLRSSIKQFSLMGAQNLISIVAGIILTSVLFGAVHILGLPSGTYSLTVFLYTTVLGFATAILAVITQRLGGPIIAHSVYNAMVLIPGVA